MKDNPTRRLFRLMFKLMAYSPPTVKVPPQGVILSDVNVVNPGSEQLTGRTFVVEGDRITRISCTDPQEPAVPRDNRFVGAFVLPGLIDMHVHIPPPIRELTSILFLAHGVTTVRETGDADGTTWRGRARIRAGEVPGPRVFASGPVLDGHPPFLPTSWAVRDATEAWEAVATLAAHGADFIKVHHKLSVEALTAIREAAVERGLRVVGHIPMSVPFKEAHIWDVQHLDGLVPYPQGSETPLDHQRKWRDLDPARIDFYVKASVEQGLVHTPTLTSGFALARLAAPHPPHEPAARFLPRYVREVAWNREHMPLFGRFSDETLALMTQADAQGHGVVHRLHQAGVRLHLGTDTAGMPFVVPGASLQQELKLMVQAGLSVEEAWTAGTRAAGQSLGVPSLGTVREGAPADLLIFDADPSRDLTALATLKGVIAQGRLYSKAFLDEALSRHRERFEGVLYDRLSTALTRLGTKLMVPKS